MINFHSEDMIAYISEDIFNIVVPIPNLKVECDFQVEWVEYICREMGQQE